MVLLILRWPLQLRRLLLKDTQTWNSDIFIGRPYALSLFRRMNFVRRRATTGKVQIPTGVLKETELNFQHRIVSIVEKYNIPPNLIINFAQTPLKYVPYRNIKGVRAYCSAHLSAQIACCLPFLSNLNRQVCCPMPRE